MYEVRECSVVLCNESGDLLGRIESRCTQPCHTSTQSVHTRTQPSNTTREGANKAGEHLVEEGGSVEDEAHKDPRRSRELDELCDGNFIAHKVTFSHTPLPSTLFSYYPYYSNVSMNLITRFKVKQGNLPRQLLC
jgi:hypothetical protein